MNENYLKKAVKLFEEKKYNDAKVICQKILRDNPKEPRTLLLITSIAIKLNKINKALEIINYTIKLFPSIPEAFYNRAYIFYNEKKFDESESDLNNAIKLNEKYIEAINLKGLIYINKNKIHDAKSCFKRIIKIDPNNIITKYNLAKLYRNSGDNENYYELLNEIIKKNKTYDFIYGDYIFSKKLIGNWHNLNHEVNELKDLINKNKKVTHTFQILSLYDEPDIQFKNSKIENEIYTRNISNSSKAIEIIKKNKIRIGYFSSDFHDHATSHLIARVLELHDKEKFEIYGFYLSNEKDDMHKRLIKSFDKFFYCGNDTDIKIVDLARRCQIDIAVDLKGYINNNKFSIFENKCAPIQINFLGYPGTTGSLNMDYIIADKNLISKNQEKYYTEKIIYLPNCYQPNDNTKKILINKLEKSNFNLPEEKIILCSFNNTYKITQEIFDIWINILKKNSNTVLWLLSNSELFEKNISNYISSKHIDSSRIIFAKPTNNADHMERLSLADLFLDSYPCSGHTTASDALWVGLPLVTIKGKTFASRVASSLLNNIGLNQMVTSSFNEYYNLACDLISNRNKLLSVKNKLKDNKFKKSLFNSEEYTKNLEKAYKEVYENKLKKLPTKNIYL